MNARFPRKIQIGASAMEITVHALNRMQERGISEELVIFLITYGAPIYSCGAYHYTFSGKHSKVDVPKGLQEKLRHHPCIVVKDDKVITVKHQYKRIKRNTNRRRSRQQYRR